MLDEHSEVADKRFPLSTLLSQILVAFTIEFDNEFEHRMPHRTSRGSTDGSRSGPWLASMAMWSTCMRFVPEEGIAVRELERRARTGTNLDGMRRWGYISLGPDPNDGRPKPPIADWIVRPTAKGIQAQKVWEPVFGEIEERWRNRFGGEQVDQLRLSLANIVGQLKIALPDCLPILRYGLVNRLGDKKPASDDVPLSKLPLSALLSKALLAFAVEFEQRSELSLATSANLVRVLDQKGVRVRDLPNLSGVSKEAISMAIGILTKLKMAVVEPDLSAARGKVIRLTTEGTEAQRESERLLKAIEERWEERFGASEVAGLRRSLEGLVSDPSTLFISLQPYPDGWRAKVPRPSVLPHFPMVLHRGGYPDGS